MIKFPIGIQSFSIIRQSGYVYVDKTAILQDLIESGERYFLSRPRRFGKSLTISTIHAMFSGKKELFNGLACEAWVCERSKNPFPVLAFDLSGVNSKDIQITTSNLRFHVKQIAEQFSMHLKGIYLEELFSELIVKVYNRLGPVVILVDEYDKPILDNIDTPDKAVQMRKLLQSFYTIIKQHDEYLRFVMLTGVSKFCKMGIFSAMNNLMDISMHSKYADLCGYTQQEILDNFHENLIYTAEQLHISYDHLLDDVKYYYDGFSFDGYTKVYNPFSIMLFLKNSKFDNYWYTSGSPTFIVKYMKQYCVDDPNVYDHVEIPKIDIDSHEIESTRPEAFLFQAGYLTIEEEHSDTFILRYPNYEVRKSIISMYLSSVYGIKNYPTLGSCIWKFFETSDMDGIVRIFNEALSSVPFDDFPDRDEYWYRSLFIMLLRGAGIVVHAEIHTNLGRTDISIVLENTIFILEFKCADTPDAISTARDLGIKQIEEKNYAKTYESEFRRLIKRVFIIDVVHRKIVL